MSYVARLKGIPFKGIYFPRFHWCQVERQVTWKRAESCGLYLQDLQKQESAGWIVSWIDRLQIVTGWRDFAEYHPAAFAGRVS